VVNTKTIMLVNIHPHMGGINQPAIDRVSQQKRLGVPTKEVGCPNKRGWVSQQKRLGVPTKEVGCPNKRGWGYQQKRLGVPTEEVGGTNKRGWGQGGRGKVLMLSTGITLHSVRTLLSDLFNAFTDKIKHD
jgi:hypothetical protein